MEERYWRSFWETGKISDYLAYVDECKPDNAESEETRESDYSDRDGAVCIAYR